MKAQSEKEFDLQLFAEDETVPAAESETSAAADTTAPTADSAAAEAPAEMTPEQYASIPELDEPQTGETAKEEIQTAATESTDPIEERLKRLEDSIARQNESLRKMENSSFLRSHFSGLERQSVALRERIPDFDLARELKDPDFLRLTSPRIGLSVEDAYYALHHAQLEKNAAQSAAVALGNSIRAGQTMPIENGGSAGIAGGGGYRSYKELSPEERAIRKEMIMSGQLRF